MTFAKPESNKWEDLHSHWYELCNELHNFVWRSSSKQSISAWQNDLDSWSIEGIDIGPKFEGKFRNELALCHALIWCALQVRELQADSLDQLNLAYFQSTVAPHYISERPYWAWDALHFLQNQSLPSKSLTIHVAIIESNQFPTIAELKLDILPNGREQQYHHPKDALLTYAHSAFADSMAAAWATNMRVLREEDHVDIEKSWNGRWRLLDETGTPVTEVDGRSASAAAAWGWWFLLHEKIPDDGIIVMAQVDENGHFSGVEGISEKVKKVVTDRRFDTIVVAGEENEQIAKKELKDIRTIRVVRFDV